MIPMRFGKTVLRTWVEMLRALGQSFLDLLRAEWDQLLRELGVSAKKLGIGVALLAGAGMVAFWFVAVLAFFLIMVIAIWLPVWASAGIALLVLLVVIGILAGLGWSRLKSIENPVDAVGRRWDDHLDWWENRLMADEHLHPEPVGAGSEKELS
jgi:hypothetical protein